MRGNVIFHHFRLFPDLILVLLHSQFRDTGANSVHIFVLTILAQIFLPGSVSSREIIWHIILVPSVILTVLVSDRLHILVQHPNLEKNIVLIISISSTNY